MSAAEVLVDDVASTRLVTVRRPSGMIPRDFQQSVRDLERLGYVRVSLEEAELAVVERTTPPATLRHIVGVPDDKQVEQQQANAIALAAGDVEQVDDHTVRIKPMPKKTVAEEIRALIAEGCLTTEELIDKLGKEQKANVHVTMAKLARQGVLKRVGPGEYRFIGWKNGSGGGQATGQAGEGAQGQRRLRLGEQAARIHVARHPDNRRQRARAARRAAPCRASSPRGRARLPHGRGLIA